MFKKSAPSIPVFMAGGFFLLLISLINLWGLQDPDLLILIPGGRFIAQCKLISIIYSIFGLGFLLMSFPMQTEVYIRLNINRDLILFLILLGLFGFIPQMNNQIILLAMGSLAVIIIILLIKSKELRIQNIKI